MNPSRRGLLLSGRRSTQAAALALGVLALGAISAPAALAMESGDTSTASATPAADTGAPRILTTSPVLGLGTAEDRVSFGVGKMQLSIAPDGTNLPAGAEVDLSGATIEFTYETVFGDPAEEETATQTCTTDNGGTCVFPDADPADADDSSYTEVTVLPGSTFTIRQLTPPTSGQLLLPEGEDAVVYGQSDDDGFPLPPGPVLDGSLPDDPFDVAAVEQAAEQAGIEVDTAPDGLAPVVDDGADGDSSVTFQGPGAYRTIAVTTATSTGGPVAGATYTLCTVPDATCTDPGQLVSATTDAQGRLTFPGRYLPGVYTITQTTTASGLQFSGTPVSLTVTAAQSVADTQTALVLPVVNAAPTTAGVPTTAVPTAAPVAAGPRLATTGTDTVPVLAAGAGLVLAGTGAVVVGRRRTRSS